MPDAAQPVMEDPKGERCPRCLQNVPFGASRCPSCGQPIHSIRSLLVAIGIAGLLVLVFVMLVMYKVMANEDAARAPVPVDEADQKQELLRDPPPASSADEPAKPDRPTKPEKKPPLDEH
jgi:hypothetical protein